MNFVSGLRDSMLERFDSVSTLEVGSLNINGSVRQFFTNPKEYVGIDLGPGPGVDMVCYGHEAPFPKNYFDTSISCECFEHDEYWQETFYKMWEVTKPNGLVIFSCATEGRPVHGTKEANPFDAPFTNHYYKNLTKEDFNNEFDLGGMFKMYFFDVNVNSHDLYFWGIKCSE